MFPIKFISLTWLVVKQVCVVDINFGLNNQKNLKAMVKRGVISRKLDLLEEKLELLKVPWRPRVKPAAFTLC